MTSTDIRPEDFTELGKLELLARQVVEGFVTGLHKSPFHGFSVEFAEHRLYNVGDNVKNIDWKLFGKTERLYSKRYEEETNLRCYLILDASSSMFYPEKGVNKFQFSALAAASIINLLKKQRDAFGLGIFAEEIELLSPAKSTTVHQKFIYHELEKYLNSASRSKKTNLAENLHHIAESVSKRAMIVIFSDFFENFSGTEELDEVFAALQHLKYNKHEVIVFDVLDKKHEVDFNFENRPYQFVDAESGESVHLNPSVYAESYKQKMTAFLRELDAKCGQYKIDLVHASIEDGYNSILQAWLIKRGKML